MATIRKRNDQYQVQIRRKGHPPQSKSFIRLADAEKWARTIESEMDRGVFVSRAEAEATTLDDALDRYAREIVPKKKGASQELNRIKHLRHYPLANRFLATIRGSDLASFRDELLTEGYAPSSVVRSLAILSHLFNVARREWGMESLVNPVELIPKPKVQNERVRRIRTATVTLKDETGQWTSKTLDELEMVAMVTESAELPSIITVAVETAMRRGEICALVKKHIDYKIRVAHLPETKNGTARDVPLSSKAVAALKYEPNRRKTGKKEEKKKKKSAFEPEESLYSKVFSIRNDGISRAFLRALTRARRLYEEGITHSLEAKGRKPSQIVLALANDPFLVDLHVHDLRHEATSRLAEIYPLHELAKITGHKDTRMLMRYYHPRAEDLAKKLA